MKKGLYVLAMTLLVVAPVQAAFEVVIDFENPVYTPGALPGQDGWFQTVGTNPLSASVTNMDNGPSLPGTQSVDFINFSPDGVSPASEIRVRRYITDVVSHPLGGPLVTFQYDIKDVFNAISFTGGAAENPFWSTTLFRGRLYDDVAGFAPIGNMHYDGGGGPANQASVGLEPDGDPSNWSPDGSPAWLDTDWHTVAWKFNYATNEFLGLEFDGVMYPHPNEWFVDWNGQGTPGGIAEVADLLSFWLMPYDNNDYWKLDNIIVRGEVPEPSAMVLLALGGFALLRRR